jgi:hypothetical protein
MTARPSLVTGDPEGLAPHVGDLVNDLFRTHAVALVRVATLLGLAGLGGAACYLVGP